MKLRRIAVVAGLAWLGCGSQIGIEVEPDSPAIQDEKLIESVGIETVGGGFAALLVAGCSLPCESTSTYSTAADSPALLSIALFRGNEPLVAQNHFLGRFTVSEIAPVDRAVPQVAITIRADSSGLHLTASDPSGGAIQLRREY